MSPRRSAVVPLAERIEALDAARDALAEVAPAEQLEQADAVLERIDARQALSAEHTVVGFFGATGSGKSSLVNALVGQAVTRAAVQRPTTSQPVAAIAGPLGADALLDWLEVAERHELDADGPLQQAAAPAPRRGVLGRRARESDAEAGAMPGLVILDLPDLDSIELSNRRVAERLTALVDVIVWVTDPQKYADDVLHHDFVVPFASHDAVTLAVLNQIDLIRPHERQGVLDSLQGLLRRDGLESAPVFGVSAMTGEGLDVLRTRLVEIARGHEAVAERHRADVRVAAGALREAADPAGLPRSISPEAQRRLEDSLAAAARIEPVADAVGRAYRHRAGGEVGWPLLRWIGRMRPDPLARLHLGGPVGGRKGREDEAALPGARTSLPEADAATAARSSQGLRGFADAVSAGGSDPWRAEVRRAARSRDADLPDALDQVVARAGLSERTRSWWWPVLNVLQWLALATWVVGLGWLALNAILAYFQLPPTPMPIIRDLWIPVPLPTALVAIGIGAGVLLAVLGGVISAFASRWHRRRALRLLRSRVAVVARTHVLEPVQETLDRADRAATDLATAAGAAPSRRV
ncbi:50S ribosome-binding GTPase [Brachybacterium sp. JHP9]|uniref:50S ribosome-binding GTPase n=1 Tax=Brachybacterium equifaecis TaxID=2910770 RepID=A0ABT0QZ78_9MICO|nr:50S ribosome-binding GTPase [Brachybacterium equifaecis]